MGLILILSFIGIDANAWYCQEVASERVAKDTIRSCGVGIAATENQARLNAFDNAREEFKRIASASSDINQKSVVINPQRTSCDKIDGQYKCYRLLVFTFENGSSHPVNVANRSIAATPTKESTIQKIKKGMKKVELLKIFGNPQSESTIGRFVLLYYVGPVCSWYLGCHITLERGRITRIEHVNPDYVQYL